MTWPFIEAAAPETYGRLMLLCDLLRALDGPEAAALALRLLRLCWDSGAATTCSSKALRSGHPIIRRGDPRPAAGR